MKAASISNTPSPRVVLLSKIQARLNQRTFSKEDSAWTEAAIRSAELLGESEFPHGVDPYSDVVSGFFRGDAPDSSLVQSLHLRQGGSATELRTYVPLNEGTSTAGGDLIPIGFYGQVVEAMKKYDGLFDAGRRIYTKTGGVLNLPSADDTSATATKIAENNPVTQGPNPVFGNAQFGLCPLWSTGQLILSQQLLTDSGIDLSAWFAKIFGVRLARGQGAQFITTLIAGVGTGVTTASATAIASDELLGLLGALDPAYANAPRCGWLMSWSTWLSIMKIKDSQNRYQFLPLEFDADGHPLLLGKPVYICPSMPSIAATNVTVVLGDMDYFVIREAMDRMNVVRYDEIYMLNHQRGFQGFMRTDAALVAPGAGGTSPFLALVQHS